MENGDNIFAKFIVSNAGIYNTYQKLLPLHIAKTDPLYKLSRRIKPSCTFVYLFVGLNGTKEGLKLRSSNIWSLNQTDYSKLMEKFYNDPYNKTPPVFIGFPSAKDSTWNERRPGKSCAVILAPCKYEWFEKWKDLDHRKRKRDSEYMLTKNKFKDIILNELYKHYPQLQDKIVYTSVGTPLTFNYYIGSTFGECYGLDCSNERYRSCDIRPKTNIKNLYLTGQDVTTLGFTGALMAGVLTTHSMLGYGNILDIITGRNLIEDIMHLG